jgi:hypothetical protein
MILGWVLHDFFEKKKAGCFKKGNAYWCGLSGFGFMEDNLISLNNITPSIYVEKILLGVLHKSLKLSSKVPKLGL